MNKMVLPKYYKDKKGQVMIMTTLAIGGTILGAATIAGLLIVYQIRQTTDLADSAKAIFAADAGIEWGLYNFFHATTPIGDPNPLSSGAEFVIKCYDGEIPPNLINCSALSTTSSIRSIGTARGVSRAFLIYLQTATSTSP